MNTLDQMAGLDQLGYPQEMGYPQDPMLQAGYADNQDAMLAQLGMQSPMQDPYAMVGMDAPQGLDEGRLLAQQMLGGQPPQLGQQEIDALAQSLGLRPSTNILFGGVEDPMYSPRFDVNQLLGGY